MSVTLTDAQIERYSRQLILPEIGPARQRQLLGASAVVIASDDVRLTACLYLAAAGIGRLAVVGALPIPPSNPDCALSTLRLDEASDPERLQSFDLVIDGSEDEAIHERLNRVCVQVGKPLIFGSAQRLGCVTLFAGHRIDAPCYACVRDLLPSPQAQPSPLDALTSGLIGTVLANAALTSLLGLGTSLAGRLLTYDVEANAFSSLPLAKDPTCPVCGA